MPQSQEIYQKTELGEIPNSWNYEILDNFLELITYGFTNPMPNTESGPFLITAKDVKEGKINYDTARYTTIEAFENLLTNKSRPLIDDVLITKDGTIGRVAVVDREGLCVNQSVAVLRSNDRIRPHFLKYLLESPGYQKLIDRDLGGTTIKHIYITRINQMLVGVPDIKEQDEILNILKTVDDKIELNLQMNKTLEDMAMALYKHWFVDFGPFQNGEFVDSELGMIPKGWEVKCLDEILDFKNQGVNTTTEKVKYSDNGTPVIRANNVSANYIDTTNIVYVDETTFAKVRTQCKPKYRDILYTNIGSQLGSASLSFMDYEYLIAWNVLRLKVNEHIYSPELLVTFFNNPKKREELRNLNSSSTMPFVSGKVLGKVQIIVPDTSNLKLISKELKYFYSLINFNHKENQTLITLRDTLLPKLINGEVRVKDIEQTISKVL